MSSSTSTVALLFSVCLVSLHGMALTDITAMSTRVSTQKSQAGQNWTNCSKVGDNAEILDIKLSTSTLDPGGTLIGNFTYLLKEAVDDITVTFYVKQGVVPIYGDSLDLCKFLDLACPLKAGPGNVVVKYPIQEFQKSGKYLLHAVLKDKDDRELACFELNITIEDEK